MHVKALGIMTGTSCDGINGALIITDGSDYIERISFFEHSFSTDLSQKLKQAGQIAQQQEFVDFNSDFIKNLEFDYTNAIIDFIRNYFDIQNIDLIGFHGQTILHRPDKGLTIQLGLPQLLANTLHTDVVFNFRQNDIKNGGQGAPLVPLYHQACVQNLPLPVVFINIGGVANVTYCGNPILGFDIGPGNCISDDLTNEFFNLPFDKNGNIAALGNIDYDIIKTLAETKIFLQSPPKSFDRNEFDVTILKQLPPADAIATANYLTAYCIIQADKFYPTPPNMRIIAGGGVYNKTLIRHIENISKIPVKIAEDIGLNSNAIEAECFAWLAVRSIKGFPLSLPTITGVKQPMSGGELFKFFS